MNNIKDKNILLLCPNFYGYDKAIKAELYNLGAKFVYLKTAKIFRSSFREPGSFHFPSFLKRPFERRTWTRNFEKEICNFSFDLFLCIENACFVKSFMSVLRLKNPNIKTILFLWDTYKTQQGHFKNYRFLFDKVYSVDRTDALQYGLEYFPDFYISTPQSHVGDYTYDISFVGTANRASTSHRIKIVDYVHPFCKEHHLHSFLYLKVNGSPYNSSNFFKRLEMKMSRHRVYKQLILHYQAEQWFHFEPLALEECNKQQAKAQVILDINHKQRQGMTINCITGLAQGQKLITTNRKIKEESFYDPDMIYVLDEDSPHLDISFWTRPNKKIDLSYLRLDNWLLHILDV